MKKKVFLRTIKFLAWTSILSFCLINTFIFPFRIEINKEENKIEAEEKADEPQKYSDYYNLIRTREGDESPRYQNGYAQSELEKARRALQYMRTTTHEPPNWRSLGPANVAGRTRAVIVDLSDASYNTWFAGTAGGGIWKTTDSGTIWKLKTPNAPNFATTTIAQSSSNPNIFYAGTGEGFSFAGSIKGSGIYKSIDHGENWSILVSTVNDNRFENINRLIIDPSNENVLLACTNTRLTDTKFFSGIMKSTDGGSTWTKVYQGSSSVQQLIYDPSDFNIQFATQFASTVLKSTDAGDTWFPVGAGLVSSGRIEVAISPEDPNRLFAATEGRTISNNASELYISSDGGQSWTLLLEMNDEDNFDWFGNQGSHNNSLTVDPFNKDQVYVGGIDLHRINLQPGDSTSSDRLLNVFEYNTQSFLGWINWGGGFLGGGFDTGEGWFAGGSNNEGYPLNLQEGDMVSLEIRFGNGASQKAHRFTVDPNSGTFSNGGQGVPPLGHHYMDYVDVPFEVWDIDNNVQLMVSFRDQERDGVFNLNERDPEDNQILAVREYIFIHAIPYDEIGPDPNVTVDGGHGYKNIYSMWPKLATGGTWDPNNLPDSKIQTNFGPLKIGYKASTRLTNANGFLDPSTVHPDHHDLKILKSTSNTFRILDANDGGVYLSNTSITPGFGDAQWTKVSGQLITGQFYGLDKKPGENIYIGGLQDNGVWLSGSNPSGLSHYILQLGGDGGEIVWNYDSPNKIIATNQYNRLFYTSDAGQNWSAITEFPDKGGGNAPFITRIGNSKKAPDLIFIVGKSGVSRSVDFGRTWTTTAIATEWMANTITSAYNVEVSKADYHIVWAGGGMSSLINMHVSTDAGTTFNPVVKYAQRTLGAISGIATHPSEPNTAYLLFSMARSPKILRTKDLGQTWEDISGFGSNETSSNGFPDVAVNCLLVNPADISTIWAGTEIGIFESIDNGANWHMLDSNMPAASIWQLKAVDNQVIVATHGRGIWAADIDGLLWPENAITGLEDQNLELSVFPNPASDYINLNFEVKSGNSYSIRLVDLRGRVVRYIDNFAKESVISERIDLDNLSNGIYLVNIESSGISQSARVMITR